MKFDLIFYLSKKTNICENTLVEKLKKYNITPNLVKGATNPKELGRQLQSSLKKCYLVFIIGDINSPNKTNLENVLSNMVSTSTGGLEIETKKIKGSNLGNNGYLLRCGVQLIVALPDNPKEIEHMINDNLINFITHFLNQEF